jgi:hypothetical protein
VPYFHFIKPLLLQLFGNGVCVCVYLNQKPFSAMSQMVMSHGTLLYNHVSYNISQRITLHSCLILSFTAHYFTIMSRITFHKVLLYIPVSYYLSRHITLQSYLI